MRYLSIPLKNRIPIVLLLWTLLCWPVFADEASRGNYDYVPAENEYWGELDPISDDTSLFKWSWEMPYYQEKYPHLQGKPWLEPADTLEAYTLLQRKREVDNQDTYRFVGYASLRPFVLDFGSYSFAFGVSYIGRLAKSHDIDKVRDVNVLGQVVPASAEGIQTEAYQQAINFSVLGSFPEHGFQFIFDVGYGTSRLRETIDRITVDAGNIVAVLDSYQYKQHDEGVFTSLNILKSFDRDYFDFVNVFLYGAFRTKTTLRNSNAELTSIINGVLVTESGKQELPFVDARGIPFDDPQQADEFDIGIFSASASLRMMKFSAAMFRMPDRHFSFYLYSAVQHTTGELIGEDFYGVRTKVGGIVGILDGVSVRYNYIFESNNDQEDGWEVSITIRVSGIIREVASVF